MEGPKLTTWEKVKCWLGSEHWCLLQESQSQIYPLMMDEGEQWGVLPRGGATELGHWNFVQVSRLSEWCLNWALDVRLWRPEKQFPRMTNLPGMTGLGVGRGDNGTSLEWRGVRPFPQGFVCQIAFHTHALFSRTTCGSEKLGPHRLINYRPHNRLHFSFWLPAQSHLALWALYLLDYLFTYSFRKFLLWLYCVSVGLRFGVTSMNNVCSHAEWANIMKYFLSQITLSTYHE